MIKKYFSVSLVILAITLSLDFAIENQVICAILLGWIGLIPVFISHPKLLLPYYFLMVSFSFLVSTLKIDPVIQNIIRQKWTYRGPISLFNLIIQSILVPF